MNRNKRFGTVLVFTALVTYALFATPASQNGALAQQIDGTAAEQFKIDLSMAPSTIERGQASYSVGFVQLTSNATGEPILAPRDLEVELSSRSPSIASVPAKVVISKATDYAKFNIDITDITGESEISALFGNQIVTKTFKVVEAGSQIPNDINLVLNLPSSKMQIGSEMPVSVYLENNGEIMQAPEDVTVFFDYDRSLLKMSSGNVVITKGTYYAIATAKSLEKSGNAFVKASTTSPVLDTVTTIEISQTQPVSLKVSAFPKKIGVNEKTVDIFVGLLDASGNPTVASNDIKLELFASSAGVQRISDASAVVKKGEFGYYLRQSLLFFDNQNVTVGATAPGLGVSTDKFEVVEDPLTAGAPKTLDKVLQIYTIPIGMPSDATAIVVYQLNAVEDDDDDDQDSNGDGEIDSSDHHAIDDLEEGEFYPMQSKLLYSAGQGNLNVVTSDINALKVTDPGSINAGSSYGTAMISSGRQPRSVDVSVSLANTASSSNSLIVTGSLTPVSTKIFSPAGLEPDQNYRVPFNQQGLADLFFLTLDSSGRPARAENGVHYLVKPINEVADIPPDSTFATLQIHSSQFSIIEPTADISAIPVGVNADSFLQVQSSFHMIFYSSITGNVVFPFGSIIGFSKLHPIGAVQLTDMFGNPLLASEDVKLTLSSARSGAIPITSITIAKGKSFANFELATFGKAESLSVAAYADGIRSTSSEIRSVLADLSGSFVERGSLMTTQPSTITVATDEGTSVLWGIPSSFEFVSKDDKASVYDASLNAYLANAQVVAARPGSYMIDVTLLKDGFKPARLSSIMTFEEYHAPLSIIIFHDSPAIEYRKPVDMNIRVVDGDSKPVQGAIVRINPGPNATAVPSGATTDSRGMVSFVYTATGAEAMGMVTATAEKAGYSMGVKTTNFEVENVPAVLPTWLLFGIIGAAGAGAGGAGILHMKKPKVEHAPRSYKAKKTEDENSDLDN
ncbi:MAG: hypothetical protein MN733_05850 [Nitrososphaera sp.]|nr:hypothetical protein [Nitrososphaera sp.]